MACWWRSSPVDVPRREEAIETALRNKLAQRAKAREAQAKAAAKEIAKFTSEFLNARPTASDSFVHVVASPTVPRAGREASLPPHRQGQLRHYREG